jgi:2-polyprenyl-6-hydroxyphenyl methylase/3-demethylubiquinone-9 3-methyltransferase
MKTNTKDTAQIAGFDAVSSEWWDEKGPFAPLHRMNPARMTYIRERTASHFGISPRDFTPFKGLSFLDIGCGGGLVCESLARLGGSVTGIDAAPQAIATAKAHSAAVSLPIVYKNLAAEDLVAQKKTFDVVCALEILEHVQNPAAFVSMCAKLVRPGGLVILSTLNRTWKSYALGIVAAEYVLGWVPKGTHDWKRFIRPSELAHMAQQANLSPQSISGLVYNPLTSDFEIRSFDTDVNYFLVATKA